MEQTVVLPIALGSKVFAVISKYNGGETEHVFDYKVLNIRITEVTLRRDGTVRHYICGNHRYLPENVHTTKEDAENWIEELKEKCLIF